jgi:adenosylcobinamide-GDP ribazoletransferase
VRDALRLAFGTLTVVPVRPPDRVDRRTGGQAMVLAPLVGLLLSAALVAVLWLCRGLPPLLAAALAVSVLALLTRGLHLDGLADTADGLGSGRSGDEALAVMRKGDVGPFGVVAVVLALLLQVSALSGLLDREDWTLSLVLATVTSRLTLPLVCSRGVPAARGEGLGSMVAGTVSRAGLMQSALLAGSAVVAVALVAPTGSAGSGLRLAFAVVLPLALAALLVLRCLQRLGGVTGDVLGACVEVAFTASLVVLASR